MASIDFGAYEPLSRDFRFLCAVTVGAGARVDRDPELP